MVKNLNATQQAMRQKLRDMAPFFYQPQNDREKRALDKLTQFGLAHQGPHNSYVATLEERNDAERELRAAFRPGAVRFWWATLQRTALEVSRMMKIPCRIEPTPARQLMLAPSTVVEQLLKDAALDLAISAHEGQPCDHGTRALLLHEEKLRERLGGAP